MGTRAELAVAGQLLDATGARPLIDRTLPMDQAARRVRRDGRGRRLRQDRLHPVTARGGAEERLLADRRTAGERLRRLRSDFGGIVEASRDSNADDEHDPEGATIAFERSQVDALVRQTEQHLVEVDAALERVAAGTYGVCERCGGQIPEARLAARPVARSCVPCASRPDPRLITAVRVVR